MNYTSNRRAFLRAAAACGAAAAFPDLLRADVGAPPLGVPPPSSPLRIRGQVRSSGRGLPRVAVSDGLAVVATDADGSFELVSDTQRQFVSVSLPSGFDIPQNPTGTARLYQPVRVDGSGEFTAEFDLEQLSESDERHTFYLLADIQVQDMDEVGWFHEQTVSDVINTHAEIGRAGAFGFACGDTVYDRLDLFPEYERAVQRMGLPFFQVLGNHDMDYGSWTDEGSTATFSRLFGPRYYSFNRGEVHYVVLDDVFWHAAGYIGYLDSEQLTWLDADLRMVEPGATVFVMAHIPILGGQHKRRGLANPGHTVAVTNRQALYRLLEPFNAHILTAHTHENEHVFENGVHEHVHGTACGAWWSGPICGDGTPSGYSVYDIDGSNVSWRYKSTGFGFDHQIRAYGLGADPNAPDEIAANVWDWDPEWTVVWYEDGERKGRMARRTGYDPLSVELHTGNELPPRRTWVDPYPTDHLFYAPASPDAESIAVEATDRFGRVYEAEVPRS